MLARLRLLQLGGEAPRIMVTAPLFMRRASYTSFSPMACLTYANNGAIPWFHGVNVRLLSSTPYSFANRDTR